MAKFRKLKVFAVLDLASLGFLIGQCIGRWGNYVNQEAFGSETSLPWGMMSENTQLVSQNPVHPCFLYESLWCLVGFILLHIFSRKFRRYDGQVFLGYIIWYGIGRFFIEGLRTDSLITPFLDLRVSQLVAAASVLAGVVLLVVFRKRTSLSGCGSAKVMELNGIRDEISQEEILQGPSTIFEDMDVSEALKEEAGEKTEEGNTSEIDEDAEKQQMTSSLSEEISSPEIEETDVDQQQDSENAFEDTVKNGDE